MVLHYVSLRHVAERFNTSLHRDAGATENRHTDGDKTKNIDAQMQT